MESRAVFLTWHLLTFLICLTIKHWFLNPLAHLIIYQFSLKHQSHINLLNPLRTFQKAGCIPPEDHVKMMNSLLFDEWSHVFQPEDDLNEIWTRWKQQLFFEVESFIPCVQRTSQDRPRQPPRFNRSIGQLIWTKNRLFNRAWSSGLPDHWEKYKPARNKATNHIRMAKSRNYFHIANTLANPTCPPSKWWNLVRSMCGLKGHASNVIPRFQVKPTYLFMMISRKLKF